MPIAYSVLPDRFEDERHASLERGLVAAGYTVTRSRPRASGAGDVLITWTRHVGREDECARWEAGGGRVIVAEEPHLKGRFPPGNERLYSLSLGDHQTAWRAGGPERWAGFGLTVAPWRPDPGPGGHIVVRDQRGIGSARMGSPRGWGEATAERLRRTSVRPVIFRPHPKRAPANAPPIAVVLRGAWCFVTWASHEGVEALLAGVPVVWCAPAGFVRAACGTRLEDVTDPPRPDRLPVLRAFGWTQWRVGEIESGEAFRWMLA